MLIGLLYIFTENNSMKTFVLFAVLLIHFHNGHAQLLKKYSIGETGCTLYLYCDPGKFDVDYSEDSSKVYTGECIKEDITYGVICIRLLAPITDLNAAEEVMISYLEYLKASSNIISAAGYGKGHILNNNENTRGVIDYWKDKDQNNWKIKAWTNGVFIAVLYASGKKELPETKVDAFLNGFRFPGM
jgi:hypothetical protein